jgi:hypothetical protein
MRALSQLLCTVVLRKNSHPGFNLSHTDHNSQPLYVYMSLSGCLTTVGLLSLRPGNSLTILTITLSVGFTRFVILGHDPS